MSQIVLATLNARYIHASFGLRYLLANMGALQSETTLLEFDINQVPIEIAERIVNHTPKIIGLGVYIWNAAQSLALVKLLKKISPDTKIVLGGPEVSFETETQEICSLADYIVCGEADLIFPKLSEDILSSVATSQKIIRALPPELSKIQMPYDLYTEDDVKNRIIYVEASRGCPFTCEFCLSSLDIPVRQFELEPFLSELNKLLERGVKHFKFVDRTFNLNMRTSQTILNFFLERYRPGMFLHFEMIPDRFPAALRELVQKFPPASVQFEVGIQSFNPEVGRLISRKQDIDKLTENLAFLRQQSGVHIHADLIVGLPGEDIESFGEGFNRLVKINPQEIQVGILKKLRGTPIARHDEEWRMVYSSDPPYEVLSTKLIEFSQMQQMKRFARYWDLISNSGNFSSTRELIWSGSADPFHSFLTFSEWLYNRALRRSGIALNSLATYLFEYLTEKLAFDKVRVNELLLSDYQRCSRTDLPRFLQDFQRLKPAGLSLKYHKPATPLLRQNRHHG